MADMKKRNDEEKQRDMAFFVSINVLNFVIGI
jgi:hypothetical protein